MKGIIIIGKPGSGKDTQMRLLGKATKLPTINIGELVRANIDKLRNEDRQKMRDGRLLDDEIIIDLLDNELAHVKTDAIILNGFPRTKRQALRLHHLEIDPVTFVLDITDQLATKRLMLRRETEHRPDDNEKTIATRLEEYYNKTHALLELLKDQSHYYVINGAGTVEEIAESIYEIFQSKINR